ncbi:hypothetical protein ACFE04_001745 [Oxalis oulophora]
MNNSTSSSSLSPPSATVEAVTKNQIDDIVRENGNEVQQVKLLSGDNDDFGGIIVEIKEHMDSIVFASRLEASIQLWKMQGKKGIWIKVPIEHVNLIEAAVKQGFWYHHAEPKYLMLVQWLPGGSHTLPVNATHRVGVGAFVMNEKKEKFFKCQILVVQEKNGKMRGSGNWKIPTGVVDEGEDICTAAVREVKEETGVDTEFVEVLAFRQSHKAFFDKSDLFFVCFLRPLSFDIQKQEIEIEAAQWMPSEEYVATPFVQKHELSKYIVEIGLARTDGKSPGFSPVPVSSTFSTEKSFMYFNSNALKKE